MSPKTLVMSLWWKVNRENPNNDRKRDIPTNAPAYSVRLKGQEEIVLEYNHHVQHFNCKFFSLEGVIYHYAVFVWFISLKNKTHLYVNYV